MAVTDVIPAVSTPQPGSARGPVSQLAALVRPAVLAGERLIAVPGPLGALLAGGGLQRGAVTVVDGKLGAGATSVLIRLLAAVTTGGEWAALLDGGGVVGGLAAGEAGVALERVGFVRGVPREQWAPVAAALIEGTALVAMVVPRGVHAADARRLAARARERGTALVATGAWPGEAAVRLRAGPTRWAGTTGALARLGARSVHVEAEGRRVGRTRAIDLVLAPGSDAGQFDAGQPVPGRVGPAVSLAG